MRVALSRLMKNFLSALVIVRVQKKKTQKVFSLFDGTAKFAEYLWLDPSVIGECTSTLHCDAYQMLHKMGITDILFYQRSLIKSSSHKLHVLGDLTDFFKTVLGGHK